MATVGTREPFELHTYNSYAGEASVHLFGPWVAKEHPLFKTVRNTFNNLITMLNNRGRTMEPKGQNVSHVHTGNFKFKIQQEIRKTNKIFFLKTQNLNCYRANPLLSRPTRRLEQNLPIPNFTKLNLLEVGTFSAKARTAGPFETEPRVTPHKRSSDGEEWGWNEIEELGKDLEGRDQTETGEDSGEKFELRATHSSHSPRWTSCPAQHFNGALNERR